MPERGRADERSLADRIRQRVRLQLGVPFERSVVAPLRRLRNASARYRPVFVTGAVGSGTTLLALSLGQRFACAGVIEEGGAQVGARSCLHVPQTDRFGSIREYRDHLAPDDGWSVEAAREDLLSMYRSYATRSGELVFDKGPNVYLFRASFLARCFPEGRWLMIFRDPVVNVEGFRRKWPLFGREPLEASVRFYRESHERFLDDAAALGDRAVVVEYEGLIEDPDAVLGALGRRWSLPGATRPPRLRSRPNVEGRGIRNVHGGEIRVVRDAGRSAYERLEPAAVESIRSELGALHERLRARALEPGAPPRAQGSRAGVAPPTSES